MTDCTACGHEATTRDPFYYDWKGEMYWIRRCRSCTHQFVHPSISPEQQRRMYDDRYFAEGGDWAVGHFDDQSYENATAELVSEAREILDLIPIRSGRLLDIGCAGGVFLNEASRAGFGVLGIELNAQQAEAARSTYGIDVVNSRIEDATVAGPFDVVTLLDVLEHVPQPLAVLGLVRTWQNPEGYLLIRGPLANSRVGRVKEAVRRRVGPIKRLDGYPLDANMFNLRSIEAMLAQSDYRITETWASHDFANILARAR